VAYCSLHPHSISTLLPIVPRLLQSSTMPTMGFFSAWIMCDGRPLPEYCIQSLESTSVNACKMSCWIPSESGKVGYKQKDWMGDLIGMLQNFSVFWRDQGSCVRSCAFISLDGFVVPGRFLSGYGTSSRDGVRTSYNTERPFAFAQQANTCKVIFLSEDLFTDIFQQLLEDKFIPTQGLSS